MQENLTAKYIMLTLLNDNKCQKIIVYYNIC